MALGTLIVAETSVYNRRVFRPLNDIAKTFAELVRKKNLTAEDLVLIHRLGFEIHAEAPKLDLGGDHG